jgi:hypothetical protein
LKPSWAIRKRTLFLEEASKVFTHGFYEDEGEKPFPKSSPRKAVKLMQ